MYAINVKNLVSVILKFTVELAYEMITDNKLARRFPSFVDYLFFLPSCYSDSTKLIRVHKYVVEFLILARILGYKFWIHIVYFFDSPHFRIYTGYSLIDYCCCYCFGFELIIVCLFVCLFGTVLVGELKFYQLCLIIFNLWLWTNTIKSKL